MKVNHIKVLLIIIFVHQSLGVNDYSQLGANWGGDCPTGIRQSPINIDTGNLFLESDDISITAMAEDITNVAISNANADELKCTYNGGNVTYSSRNETSNWNLLQFHFHAPAEHTINGQNYSLCMHNVFTKDGNTSQLLVLGILWELDTSAGDDEFITALNLDNVAGTSSTINNASLSSLFSWTNSQQKFNYKGSLTTPDCTESVEWMVVRTVKKINQSQLNLFTTLWAGNSSFASGTGNGNNRAIQATNRRQVNLIGYSDDDDDYDWVWPVLSVVIALMCVAIFVAVVMTICYCKKTRSDAYAEEEPKKNVHNASEVDQVPLENEG